MALKTGFGILSGGFIEPPTIVAEENQVQPLVAIESITKLILAVESIFCIPVLSKGVLSPVSP